MIGSGIFSGAISRSSGSTAVPMAKNSITRDCHAWLPSWISTPTTPSAFAAAADSRTVHVAVDSREKEVHAFAMVVVDGWSRRWDDVQAQASANCCEGRSHGGKPREFERIAQ